jgi:large subunit GTPase 1
MPKNSNKGPVSSIGRSIINSRKKQFSKPHHHTAVIEEVANPLQSVIDPSTLSDYLMVAELENKKFQTIRDTKIKTDRTVIDMNALVNANKPKIDEKDVKITVPRRPKWNNSMSAEQLNDQEGKSFVNWRREIASYEEELLAHKIFTPFEKNIEVWRQMWRVIEKSDIICQIVDGRNPLFFRTEDLESYVKEVDPVKENVLLINKADLLSEEIRKIWSNYLNSKGITHIFFSAKEEQAKIDELPEDHKFEEIKTAGQELKTNDYKLFNRDTLFVVLKQLAEAVREKRLASKQIAVPIKEEPQVPKKVDKNKDGKIVEGKINEKSKEEKEEQRSKEVTIGMVGYPNVGKSSVINVLCKRKLVGVAARPGKTKHFQTLFLEKELLLCDCPGLVFPNFTSTRAEMYCNAVLPIDNIKDYLSPVQYLVERIPNHVFEIIYHMRIDLPHPTASQMLQHISKAKGHLTGRSLPDEAKAARIMLKDLVNGKILYCALPPDFDPTKYPVPINQTNEYDAAILKTLEERKLKPEENLESEKLELLEEFKGDEEKKFFAKNQQKPLAVEDLDPEDIEQLQQGKTVKGIKLNKQQKRDLKFAMQRGQPIDMNNFVDGKMYESKSGAKTTGKFASDYVKTDIVNPLHIKN